jgi:NitT/TauT family transport system permease protein
MNAAWLRSSRDFVFVLLALLALWQGLHLWAGGSVLSAPGPTLAFLWDLVRQDRFMPHLRETSTAFAQALLIVWLGGVTVGVTLGAHRLSGEVAEPLIVGLYSIPKVTLYPVILLMFGLGMSAKVAFGTLQGIIPVILFSMNAVRNVNRSYIRSANVMHLSPLQTGWFVLMPAALPEIFSGLRIGFSLTVLGTMLGELFASQRGLGFLLMSAIELQDGKTILALAILISAFAVAMNALLGAVERRLYRHSPQGSSGRL